MTVKVDNFAGTMEFTAPAGGVTAFTPYKNTGTQQLIVPCKSAASGTTFAAYVDGVILRDCDVATGDGFTPGMPATWTTGNEFALPTTGVATTCHAIAVETIASGTETGDFLLRLPFTISLP